MASPAARSEEAAKLGPTPQAILTEMQRAADWQLAHPFPFKTIDWTQATWDAGLVALAGISADPRYRDAILDSGRRDLWKLGPRPYDADDLCVGQTYAELYLLYRNRDMIAPLTVSLDNVLAHPSKVETLDFRTPEGRLRETWCWCDSLFMAPPAWARLYAATGDVRFLDYAISQWWRTVAYLYAKDDHLFYRDSTYFGEHGPNGRKVYWSRGNGWVMAGTVRMLQCMPRNHPDFPRFVNLLSEMAEAVAAAQQSDGLWRPSLLDPENYPQKESSGTALFTYALAWGVNQGVLDRAKYGSAVRKAWAGLQTCVDPSGKLNDVQPIGSSPKRFPEGSSEPYGTGAYLLAGSELYRMSVLEAAPRRVITVTNTTSDRREAETVEIARPVGAGPVAVIDGVSSRILDSQVYSDPDAHGSDVLLFQTDLDPNESRLFDLVDASALAAIPHPIAKVFTRQVPERANDVAWESDRIAHRLFQESLAKTEGTVSSGVDVWVKRTRRSVIDAWYRRGDYHRDHGEGLDDYQVSQSRGCGGLGILNGGRLYVSSNFRTCRTIANGPIRAEFEVTYADWDASGRRVSEVRRIRIDAGSNMSRAVSTFMSDDPSPLTIGIGIARRPRDEGGLRENLQEGWMSYWQPADRDRGSIACAVVLPEGATKFSNDSTSFKHPQEAAATTPGIEGYPPMSNELAHALAEVGKPFTYYFGAGWSLSGDFPSQGDWESYVRAFAARIKAPAKVTLGPETVPQAR